MTKKKTDETVQRLLDDAHREGKLSKAALGTLSVVDLGAQIQAGLGVHVDDLDASEVVLVAMMPDDSGSISHAGNADAVRTGHNLVLDALKASAQGTEALVHTRYLNGRVLYPYVSVDRATAMDQNNYNPSLGTPLYDQTVVLLGTVLAKAQELEAAGVPVRTITLLLSDGADEHSRLHRAADVRQLVTDLVATSQHTVCAMGLSDGHTDFRKVFGEMGIAPDWVLTPNNTPTDIRRAFQVFSRSAMSVGQGGGLGGFIN